MSDFDTDNSCIDRGLLQNGFLMRMPVSFIRSFRDVMRYIAVGSVCLFIGAAVDAQTDPIRRITRELEQGREAYINALLESMERQNERKEND